MTVEIRAHSPLGASGAYRWMECPGSVYNSEGVDDPESDFAAEGTAAHTLAAYCLENGADAWQSIDLYPSPKGGFQSAPPSDGAFVVTKDMADAVQVYLDGIRQRYGDVAKRNDCGIEESFHVPTIHDLFYGTSDFWVLDSTEELHIWDYKHGAGIVVEVQDNPQLKYYAAGVLTKLGLWGYVKRVVLHICQPRGFMDPIRSWGISTSDLRAWIIDKLVPSMDRALESRDTKSGDHCRFCPARFRACPQLLSDMEEFMAIKEKMDALKGAAHLTTEDLARFLNLGEVLKIAHKAARETAYQRAQHGTVIPGWKLAKAKSNRVWKDDAEEKARAQFGDDAFTKPVLKSPAQLEALPLGDTFAKEHAFKPETGLQLVPDSDPRSEAGPAKKTMFKPVKKSKKS
jgi:hypothetical protein